MLKVLPGSVTTRHAEQQLRSDNIAMVLRITWSSCGPVPAALLVDGRSPLRSCTVSETLPFHSPTKLARKLLPVTCIVAGPTGVRWTPHSHGAGTRWLVADQEPCTTTRQACGGCWQLLHPAQLQSRHMSAESNSLAPCTVAEQAHVSYGQVIALRTVAGHIAAGGEWLHPSD